MITVLNIILCSSLLIALYHLVLAKEKMYRFNRFYLLLSLVFSYTVPFISVTIKAPEQISRVKTTAETTLKAIDLSPVQESFDRADLIRMIYGTVTLILFAKAAVSFIKIRRLKGQEITYQGRRMVLTEKPLSPFSFWDTVYLGKNYFTKGILDQRIFLHEECHLEQRHSLDLLLAELFSIFTWFNPAVYLYKKAIITNHEFLADEAVLKHEFNIKDYQNLIVQEIISAQNYNLTHTFTFKNTKKRFIMMNTRKSGLADVKKLISFPVLLIAFGLFVQKTYAYPVEKISKETQERLSGPVKNPVPENTGETSGTDESKSSDQLIEAPEGIDIDEERPVQDTIRPKEGRNTESPGNTAQNTSSVIQDESMVLPQFPGGMNELRTRISNSFDGSKMRSEKAKEMVRADISYTVNEEGNVENLKVSGTDELFNTEVLASFKRANENTVWKPAEKDGKPVDYTMRIPLTMSFQ